MLLVLVLVGLGLIFVWVVLFGSGGVIVLVFVVGGSFCILGLVCIGVIVVGLMLICVVVFVVGGWGVGFIGGLLLLGFVLKVGNGLFLVLGFWLCFIVGEVLNGELDVGLDLLRFGMLNIGLGVFGVFVMLDGGLVLFMGINGVGWGEIGFG